MKRPQYTTLKYLPYNLEGVDARRIIRLFNLIVYWYLKTFIIMAKFDLKFKDVQDEATISVFILENNIRIEQYCQYSDNVNCIDLDKSTAIKFAKTLRTEINKIQEGGSNG